MLLSRSYYYLFCQQSLIGVLKRHAEFYSLDAVRQNAFITTNKVSKLITGDLATVALPQVYELLSNPPLEVRPNQMVFRPRNIASMIQLICNFSHY